MAIGNNPYGIGVKSIGGWLLETIPTGLRDEHRWMAIGNNPYGIA